VNRLFLTPKGVLRLRFRIALSFALVGLVIAVIMSVSLSYVASGQVFSQIQRRALTAAQLAAAQQDGDLHAQLVRPEDDNSDAYRLLQSKNTQILASDPDITSVYTMRLDENNNIYFVVDVVRDDIALVAEAAKLGEFYIEGTPLLTQNFTSMTDAIVEEEIYTDNWGTTLSAYAPFYRSDGTLEGIIGVDISAESIQATRQSFHNLSSTITIIVVLLVSALGFALGSLTARPLEEMSESAEKMIAGDFTQGVRVGSQDEIGMLAGSFNQMNTQLRSLITDLEGRVAERTVALTSRSEELEKLAAQEERRAIQLQAIAQVSAIINTVQNIEELLPRITGVISDQFEYYHVGIFLLSEDRRFAILRAANSEGGQKMLARNHRLQVGGAGIVGFVTSTGIPRIALDVGDDAFFFNNPDLPDTRSEVAVPLRLGKQIIGALDVQSTRAAAFSQSDIDLLSVLADQVTVALENARVFEETRKSLAEAQNIYRQYLRTQWTEFIREEKRVGYTYGQAKTQALNVHQVAPEIDEARSTGETKIVQEEDARVAVPIKLRGEVIGVLRLKSEGNREWSEDELDIIRAVAERVAIASENARLVTETQRKAAKEETIGQITSKISSSVNMRNILQTTVEELGRALPGSEIVIQFRENNEQG
jgi:GAF domain-containing protein/methyl-accepting chemotaxis protein